KAEQSAQIRSKSRQSRNCSENAISKPMVARLVFGIVQVSDERMGGMRSEMSEPEGIVAPSSGSEPACVQFGALCWRMHQGGAEILLITSRDTGRWIVPKGWPMPDLSGHEAARIEAWE